MKSDGAKYKKLFTKKRYYNKNGENKSKRIKLNLK